MAGNLPIPFGNPATYPGHSGVDFPQPRGTVFRASAPGVVGLRSSNSRGGNMVWLDYDGYPGVAYAHLDDYRDSPPVGTRVNEGDIIGRVGNTGNSTGPHLHVEVFGHATTDGFWQFFNPNRVVGGGGGGGGSADIAAGQRTAGPNGARRRSDPSSQSAEAGEALTPGTIGNFTGWIRGENVEGNPVWYQGTSGNWFWSGGFVEGANGTGLTDLNPVTPPPVGAGQRRAIAGSNGRSAPNTSAEIRQTLPEGTVGDFNGWITGESVEGESRWIRGAHSGDWFWLGAFEPRNVDGLADLNVVTPPPDGGTEADFTPDVKTPTAADFPKWIRYEEVIDPEALNPTLNKDAAKYYGTEYDPIESHTHWWGLPGQSGTHDGNVTYIKGKADLSVNYVVSENRVTLMVPLNKIALTTGKRNPFAWKSENDPALTEQQYVTMGFLHYLVEKLNPKLKGEAIRLHKEFYDTTCSQIDPAKVRSIANKFASGALDPATGKPPVTEPEPDTVSVEREMLMTWRASLMTTVDEIDSLLS